MFVEPYLQDLRAARYGPRAAARYVWRCMHLSYDAALHRPRALRSVILAGLGHLVVLFAVSVAVSFLVDRRLAVEYFIFSSWWLLGGLAWIAFHLRMFRTDEDLPFTGLGLPNFLTLGRLLAIPAFYLFIIEGHRSLALAAFLTGALSDVADGVAARRLNASTRMGRIFDPIVDVLFNVSVVVGLARAGYLSEWILTLVLIRYGLLMFGAAWIYITHGPVAIRPTVLGKSAGVITTGLVLAVVLARHLLQPQSAAQLVELLEIALGFVLLLTTVQVVIIGIYNLRHAGHVPEAHGPMAVVLGKAGVEDGAATPPESR
jgi:phosphatidylglycerophosphate synthase